MALRVVLAEDAYLIRESVERLLEREDDIELVGVCGDLGGVSRPVKREKPDVLVTDIRMPPGNSDERIKPAETLREASPGTACWR